MTDQEKRDEGYRWSDSIGKAQRAFLNYYGIELYQEWRKSKMPLKNFELLLNERYGWKPSNSTPVYDEYGKFQYGY